MTQAGWRLQAPGDLVFVREGAPLYNTAEDVAVLTNLPTARTKHAEMAIVLSVGKEMLGSTRPTYVLLSKRMTMLWVDAYWCSRF